MALLFDVDMMRRTMMEMEVLSPPLFLESGAHAPGVRSRDEALPRGNAMPGS